MVEARWLRLRVSGLVERSQEIIEAPLLAIKLGGEDILGKQIDIREQQNLDITMSAETSAKLNVEVSGAFAANGEHQIGTVQIILEELLAACANNQAAVLGFQLGTQSEPLSIRVNLLLEIRDTSEVQAEADMHHKSFQVEIGRFESAGDLVVLESAILHIRTAIALTENLNPAKSARLAGLGAALAMRYQRLGYLSDLREATSLLTFAVETTDDTDPKKKQYLQNLAGMQKFNYKASGDISFLIASIQSSQIADSLTDNGQPSKRPILHSIATAYMSLYEHSLNLDHLESGIATFRRALALGKIADLWKLRVAAGLGSALRYKFERSRDIYDLEESIFHLWSTVPLIPPSSLFKSKFLIYLGISLRLYYTATADGAALDESISTLHEAVARAGQSHPDWSICLSELGSSQRIQFLRTGHSQDIVDSIANLEASLRHSPEIELPRNLCDLALAQQAKFDRFGDIGDLESSLTSSQRVIDITEGGHKTRIVALYALGTSKRMRYEHLGDLEDLQAAVSNITESMDIAVATSYIDRPDIHSELGRTLVIRYELLGQESDLEEAIKNNRLAITLGDSTGGGKSWRLCNLADSLRQRFDLHGDLNDLEEAIDRYSLAVELASGRNRELALALNNLAIAQLRRFNHTGEIDELNKAILNCRKALDEKDTNAYNKAIFFFTLSTCRLARFIRFDNLNDLQDSIRDIKNAVEFIPDINPNKPSYLTNLGISLSRRFIRLGRLSDLEDALYNLDQAARLTRNESPRKPGRLMNLASSLMHRFHHLEDPADLHGSISNLQQALDLTSDGDEIRPHILASIGRNERIRYEQMNTLDDLHSSIRNLQQAIMLIDDAYPGKTEYYESLGSSQEALFKQIGNEADMDAAIASQRTALKITADGDPSKPRQLCMLGIRLRTRSANDEACGLLRSAIALTDDSDPEKAQYWMALAQTLKFRVLSDDHRSDYDEAISCYREAAKSKSAFSDISLKAAAQWADLAQLYNQLDSALAGYRTALEILPKFAWLGLDLPSRQMRLSRYKVEDLSRTAASCAIQSGCFEEAVEFLDLGRSILWQQASSLRGDLDLLREKEPKLAEEFESAGRRLQSGNFSEDFLALTDDRRSKAEITRERRVLVDFWDELLERIRQLPEFLSFLKPVPFQQLRQAASAGPIIAINVSKHGVDALVIDATQPVKHIALPDADYLDITEQVENLTLKRPQNPSPEQRKKYVNGYLKPALRATWNDIVVPIFEHMNISLEPDGPPLQRVWWYPTGPLTFLPLHAAGPGSGQVDVSALVVSSYTPTLASLYHSQKSKPSSEKQQRKLLAISQVNTPGQAPLPQASTEVHSIIEVVHQAGWSSSNIALLEDISATRSQVIGALETCSWAHFACHGMQDPTVGMRSSFALHDGALELEQIVAKQLSAAQFAFLSVCHAASGMRTLPGEAMHLAGGLQFAGFSSVVATMWAINDEDAPLIAHHFYQYLLRDGLDECDPSNAAAALNYAVARLRAEHNVSVERWAPFIHFGI
ncbi:hypothetical protein HWV62_7244 [Athelia sp. TMB]|nr:hypothetical protein HWV62_7244 [Athelia sp. TMB]